MSGEEWPKEKISKLDAAYRQLCTAIRLFFEEGDTVSIRTLTAASHEIIRVLAKRNGGGSMMKDSDFIKPEQRKGYEDLINKPHNFFKHGIRDSHATLEFMPDETPFWISDCIMMDRKLRGKPSYPFVEFSVFMIWFTIQYPDLLTDEASALFSDDVRIEFRKIRASGSAKQSCLALIKHPERFPMIYNSVF